MHHKWSLFSKCCGAGHDPPTSCPPLHEFIEPRLTLSFYYRVLLDIEIGKNTIETHIFETNRNDDGSGVLSPLKYQTMSRPTSRSLDMVLEPAVCKCDKL